MSDKSIKFGERYGTKDPTAIAAALGLQEDPSTGRPFTYFGVEIQIAPRSFEFSFKYGDKSYHGTIKRERGNRGRWYAERWCTDDLDSTTCFHGMNFLSMVTQVTKDHLK